MSMPLICLAVYSSKMAMGNGGQKFQLIKNDSFLWFLSVEKSNMSFLRRERKDQGPCTLFKELLKYLC